MSSPTALYRRYRPDTFQDVIGQEHVTEPLMTALRKDRVNHAYLFSGPRGCGKTTSARILARCLNCEKGPTPEPCGVCPSCVELARGGSGSLDVIEIDAASHGGVDDARDLRERATFAPVRDRYKIFIIDEAHMVTSAGFNALLKIVEEPPEHIKFIFATTEPDKVIGTIRSRTHHYPFRLVPPEPLMAYLEQLCAAEHVPVEPGVLSLVVRAGGGSVRDSLSVLDQLMAGAGTGGIDYELAVALLGYTHAALLDDVVDAVAAGDSATVFRAVDRVVQTGHDPRRFVEDLLERFRDLIIVRALPDAAESILRGVPADQLARMRTQAQSIGAFELSRAADVTNAAFNEMTGATSPRLHLELLCARLMLPAADGDQGLAARLDRLERRLAFGGTGEAGATGTLAPASELATAEAVTAEAMTPEPARATERSRATGAAETPAAPAAGEPKPRQAAPGSEPSAAGPAPAAEAPAEPVPARPGSASQAPASQVPEPTVPSAPEPSAARAPQEAAPAPAPPAPVQQAPARPAPAGGGSGGAGSVEMFRRAWPEILEALTSIKRLTWILVSQNANVAGFDGRTLTLAFANSGSAGSFSRGDHSDNVRRAIQQVLGTDVQIDSTMGGNGPSPAAARGAEASPKAPADPPQRPSAPENRAVELPTSAAAEPEPLASPAPPASPSPVPPASPSPDSQREAPAPSAADIAWGLASAPAPSEPEQSTPQQPAPPMATPERQAPAQSKPATPGTPPTRPEPTPAQSKPATPATEPTSPEPTRTESRPATPATEPTSPEPTRTESRPATPATEPTSPEPDQAAPAGSGPSDPYGDIPFADDEPPADWDEPLPEDDGWRGKSGPGKPAPSKPAPSKAAPSKAASGKPSNDPWTYARESAPGVWSVGSEPNTSGPEQPSPRPEATQAPEPPSPSYAPAAAQPPVPATAQATEQRRAQAPAQPAPEREPGPAAGGGKPLSMYQRLSQRAAQERGPASRPGTAPEPAQARPAVEDIPSADDETVEASGLFGRAAVERILGGKLVEERSHDGTVIPPR